MEYTKHKSNKRYNKETLRLISLFLHRINTNRYITLTYYINARLHISLKFSIRLQFHGPELIKRNDSR